MSADDYEYDKELTSSSLSSTSEQGSRIPKPPQKARSGSSSNIYSRQRIYKNYSESNTNKFSFGRSDSIDESSIHPNDDVIKILNTTPTLSSRLSKYSALPKISNSRNNSGNRIKDNNSPSSRPDSELASNYDFDYNDLYDDEDINILIGLRLPDGTKKQKTFSSNTKLKTVLKFGLEEMAVDTCSDSNYTLLQLPNNMFDNLDKTIKKSNIKNRSMLFVIDKSLNNRDID